MKAIHRSICTAVLLLTVGFMTQPAALAELIFATNPTGGLTLDGSSQLKTIGTPFTVGSTGKTVSALGYFDDFGDGLVHSHTVGIFDADQNLLVSVTVPAGTGTPLTDGTRWVTLETPLALSAQTSYMLAATLQFTGDEMNLSSDAQVTILNGFALGGLNFAGYTFVNNSSFSFPDQEGLTEYAFGPNMMISAVPEPSAGALGVAALSPLAAWLSRRNRR